MKTLANWPDPASVPIGRGGYQTPEGTFPRVTSILKVLGLATEGLIKWSANEERKAVLEAARVCYEAEQIPGTDRSAWTTDNFIATVEDRIGPARQHQKQLQKGAEIGTQVHAAVHDFLSGRTATALEGPAKIALDSFLDWWSKSGLSVVRTEQPVWDARDGFAGTIDIVAEHPANGLGVVDLKTSKGLYTDHHLQVSAYMHAGRNFADLKWAQIVRLPKNLEDPGFEVRPLGALFDRQLGQDQLYKVFSAALTVYKLLIAKG